MKGFAMIKIGKTGWIEKKEPTCGPMDAICKPLPWLPAPPTFTPSGRGQSVTERT